MTNIGSALDLHNRLMHGFGGSDWHDGALRERILDLNKDITAMVEAAKVTFTPTDNGQGAHGYIVKLDGERVGWVSKIEKDGRLPKWTATDTFMVPLHWRYATRKAAVDALVRRFNKALAP